MPQVAYLNTSSLFPCSLFTFHTKIRANANCYEYYKKNFKPTEPKHAKCIGIPNLNLTSSSAVADEPARRAASRQTAKCKSHVTITTPLLWVICHPVARIDIAYLCTKFDFMFSRSSVMIGAPKILMGHMT